MDDSTTPSDNISRLQQSESIGVSIPIVIDLDGTLLKTDSLVETLMLFFKSNPLSFWLIFVWLAKGKAYLKQQIARRVTLDVSSLPYNMDVLNFLRDQHLNKRTLVLATGADEHIAQSIADYLHMFDSVIASNGKINLSGIYKKKRLVAEFGVGGFDYLGNDRKDLCIWQIARCSMVVGSKIFIDRIRKQLSNMERVFELKTTSFLTWFYALRLYQWLKNILVFVPLLAAHQFMDTGLILSASVAFLSFGFCASSVYLLNDLLDLTEDRKHPRKRFRPFASGSLSLLSGLSAAPLLLGLSIVTGLILPRSFLIVLGIYYVTTLLYSLRLKRIVILDVIVLAILFTERMMAGSAAIEIWPSSWLLAFSMFIFTSLALVKRYAELATMRIEYGENAKARNYIVSDSELLMSIGIASAFVSILVLVLYIASGTAQLSYGRHTLIWLVCPVLLYWLCYIWLIAHRGDMHDDPMIFALKDQVSRIILASMLIIMLLAL